MKVTTGISRKVSEGNTPFDNDTMDMTDVVHWVVEKAIRRIASRMINEDITLMDTKAKDVCRLFNIYPTLVYDDIDGLYQYAARLIRTADGNVPDELTEEAEELADRYLEEGTERLLSKLTSE